MATAKKATAKKAAAKKPAAKKVAAKKPAAAHAGAKAKLKQAAKTGSKVSRKSRGAS